MPRLSPLASRPSPLALFLLLSLLSLLSLFLLPACELDRGPDLIRVTDLLPREAEVGDRLEISGEGFPQGKTARLTLRGHVYRPGEPRRSVVVVTDGPTTSSSRIELLLTEAIEAELCDHGDLALHGTFRGTLEVAFAAGMRGAPPVTGTLRDVTLDLVPSSVRGYRITEKTREGEAFARFLGLTLAPKDGHLVITQVAPGSRADRAGLAPGDALTSLDGLGLRDLSDFSTAEEHTSFVGLSKGGREEKREIPVEGYGPRLPRDVTIVLLAGLAALLLACVLFVAIPEPLRWLEERTAISLRLAVEERRISVPALGTLLVLPVISILVGAGARLVPGFDGDVALALVLLVGCGLIASVEGTMEGGLSRWRRFLVSLVTGVVTLLGFSLVLETRGSLRLSELARTSGHGPAEWAMCRSPGLLLAAFATFAAIVLARATRRATTALSRTGDAVAVPVFVALFLGGAGVTEASALGDKLLGASFFAGKCVATMLLLCAATRAFPPTWKPLVLRRSATVLFPLSVIAVLAHLAWTRLPLGLALRADVPVVLAAIPAILGLRTIVRTVWLAARPRNAFDLSLVGPGKSWLV